MPVILAGGSGVRLWPMSRESFPKQFLRLTGSHSLFQQTILRAQQIAETDQFIIVSNIQHHFLCLEHLHEIGIHNAKFILEPTARNTAPAIACAAFYAQDLLDSFVNLLVMPSDHLFQDQNVFVNAVHEAAEVAEKSWLVTFGIKPTAPETGYGYIEVSEKKIEKSFRIKRFIEKPNLQSAEDFIANDQFYWNSGMFLFQSGTYLQELERLQPEIYILSKKSYLDGQKKSDSIILEENIFKDCPNVSIDYAVMELSDKVAMLPLVSEWSDLGSWLAVAKAGKEDNCHNVLQGNVIAEDTHNCFIRADERFVAAIGIKDQIIVSTEDALLVVGKDHSQHVKHIVNQLKLDKKKLATHHKKIDHDWGSYEVLMESDFLQLRQLIIKPEKKISFCINGFYAYWVHISGEGEIWNTSQKVQFINHLAYSLKNDNTYLLSNLGDENLYLIELQFISQKSISEKKMIDEKSYV